MPLRQLCSYLCDLSVGELSAPKVRRSFQAVNTIVTRSIGLALNGPFCVDPAGRRGFRYPQVVERREGQGDQKNGPGVVDLDQLAALFHLQKPSTGNAQQRTNELLVGLAGLWREQEDRRTQSEGDDYGGNRGLPVASPLEFPRWITVTQAARVCGALPSVISRAVTEGKIRSNGKKGVARRIDTLDLVPWALSQAKRPEPKESDAQVSKLVDKEVSK
jgi:hypothetical protein